MISFIKKIYEIERFYPSLLCIFLNPYYFVRKGLTKGVISHAGKFNGKVIDLGCGSRPYESLFVNASDYIGVDVEISGHDHEGEDIDVYYDCNTLPFDDESVDGYLCFYVLEHIENLDEVMSEVTRTLKPEGKILITIPFLWHEHEAPYDFRRFTSFGLKSYLEGNNFTNIEIKKTNNSVEAIFQSWNAYLFNILYSKNLLLDTIFAFLFIAPFTLLGALLSKVLPKDTSLYSSLVVYAEKAG